jgi:general secretion pathway protein L
MGFLVLELLRRESVATRFRVNGRKIVCEQSERIPTGSGADLHAFLEAAAAACGEDDTVILALDPSLLSSREVALPLTDRRKIREILPLELKGETACDTDELIFDSVQRGDGTQLAVWGRKRDISAQIELLTSAGLEPQAVTASLFHWQHLLPPGADGGTVLVVDPSGAAVYRGGEPLLFRTFWGEEPVVEIERTVAALELTEGVIVERTYLIGELAGMTIPADKGSTWLPLPAPTDLESAFGGDLSAAVVRAGAWAVVRAARKGELVNFRHGDLAWVSGSRTVRKKILVSAILAAVALLIIFADLGLRYGFVRNDLDSLNTSIGAIYRDIFPKRKKAVDEVGELKSEIKRLSGAGAGISALATLKMLAELKGDDITGFYETEIDGNQVQLKGDARSIQAVTTLKTRAGAALTGVEVGEIRTKADGSATFTLRGTLKEEAR